MKAENSRKSSATEANRGVADDLIRQVSESVIARASSRRNRTKNTPLPVLKKTADEPAQQPIRSEPPVLLESRRVIAGTSAPVIVAFVEPPPIQTHAEIQAQAEIPPPAPPAPRAQSGKRVLALFTYVEPASAIGHYIAQTAPLLAQRGFEVQIYSRHAFNLNAEGVTENVLGLCESGSILGSVEEFTLRARAAFNHAFPADTARVTALGFEWSAAKMLQDLSHVNKIPFILSLHSLESQRSDLSSEVSRTIHGIELETMRLARSLLIHNASVGDAATARLPEVRERILLAEQAFPVQEFDTKLDAGSVKARFQIGPVDPVILFVGDFDERHGPDVLMKSAPAILKNHKQARFVFVGDGALQWPVRVHARYLLLDYAVRFLGHLAGKELQELIAASDVICVPSRAKTEEWPVLAAWAAKKPVVTTHQMAGSFLKHEQDCVLCYPNENSVVWGVERVLFDENLRQTLGEKGHAKLSQTYGWNRVAGQLELLMNVKQATV